MIRKLAPFIVLTVVVIALHIQRSRNQPIDIIGDLQEIRQTMTPVELEMENYYRNLDIIDSLLSKGDYSIAALFVDSLIQFKDNRLERYLLERGKISFHQSEFDTALTFFRRAIEISDGFNLRAREWKAFAHLNLNNCDSAVFEIKIAEEKNSMFAESGERIKEHCRNLQIQ